MLSCINTHSLIHSIYNPFFSKPYISSSLPQFNLTPQTTSSSKYICEDREENGKTNVSRRFSNENRVWVRFNPVQLHPLFLYMLTGCYLNFMQDSCVLRLSMLFVPPYFHSNKISHSHVYSNTNEKLKKWLSYSHTMPSHHHPYSENFKMCLLAASAAVKIHPIYDDTFMYAEQ